MKHQQQQDPFADYIEWTEHRYNPGHYLGGTLPPHLRKASLGRRGRRLAGVFLAGIAILTGASGVLDFRSWWERLLYVPIVVLIATAAVKMFRAGDKETRE